MAQGASGVTTNTASRLVIDAGVVYYDIDVTALEDGSASTPVADAKASGTLLGATRGGNVFSSGRTMREMEADGKLGPTKGFKRRQEVAATLQVNLLEVTSDTLAEVFAGSNSATAGLFTKITGGGTCLLSKLPTSACLMRMNSSCRSRSVRTLTHPRPLRNPGPFTCPRPKPSSRPPSLLVEGIIFASPGTIIDAQTFVAAYPGGRPQ